MIAIVLQFFHLLFVAIHAKALTVNKICFSCIWLYIVGFCVMLNKCKIQLNHTLLLKDYIIITFILLFSADR
jgi:hypothetical protein